MDLAQQSQPSLWYSLLWKDFRLIRSTLVAVTSGVFVMQLISLAISFATNDTRREGALASTSILASLAPILFAVGCSGMLIGHERQTGTWAWSSSLPMSWRQALASKLAVSLIGAVFVGALLAIIPLTLLITGRLVVSDTSLATVYVSGLTVIALLEVIVCFYFASLMIRETLTALVVAGLVLSLGQLMVAVGVVVALKNAGFEEFRAGALFGWVSSVLIVLLGVVAMIVAFRWRWGVGQATELSLWPGTSVAAAPNATAYEYTSGVAPSEWWMHLRHAFTNSRLMRLSVFLAVCLLSSLGIVEPSFLLMVASLAGGIYGLSAFEGDQTLERFRFLADRGITPWKLVASRLSVAAVWALLTGCIVMVAWTPGRLGQPAQPEWLAACVLGLLAFLLSALASLCFRKAVIAATVAMVVSLALLSTSIATIDFVATNLRTFGVAELDFRKLSHLVLWWTPLTMLVLLGATFRLARRWIIYQEPRLPLRFVGAICLAFFLPALLAIHSIFLLIPNVPWQGVTLAELRREPIFIPDLKSLEEPQWPLPIAKLNVELDQLFSTVPVDVLAIERFHTPLDQALAELLKAPEPREHVPAQTVKARFVEMADGFASRFEERLRSSSTSIDFEEASLVVSDWIAFTATLARVAGGSGEPQLALRWWRINRDLQGLAKECDLLATSYARNFSMRMLQQLSDADIEAMGGPDVFDSLIPKAADERSAAIKDLREYATFGREYVRGNVQPFGRYSDVKAPQSARLLIRYYLPVRWFLERKLALDIQTETEYYATQRMDFQTGEARDALLQRKP